MVVVLAISVPRAGAAGDMAGKDELAGRGRLAHT